MNVYTIGFTKKTAEAFFTTICQSGAKRIVDVRLNNVSQLSGFAKRGDLEYFAREICGLDYVHELRLAPTQDLLDEYRKKGGDWPAYERGFVELIRSRHIEDTVPQSVIHDGCLLCSEEKPLRCHRRLVAEYLKGCWGNIDIVHL